MDAHAQRVSEFFFPIVSDAFHGINTSEKVPAYVTGVLSDFAKTTRLYAPLGRIGIEEYQSPYIADMIKQAEYNSIGVQRIIRQHIGDYTLFMLGLFRPYVKRKGFESLYLGSGRQSYEFTARHYDDPDLSLLFSELSGRFEACVTALNTMRERHLHFAASSVRNDVMKFVESMDVIDAIGVSGSPRNVSLK